MKPLWCASLVIVLILPAVAAPSAKFPSNPYERVLHDYFTAETGRLAQRCLAEIESSDDWQSRREIYRRQLQEMLGLAPWPERTDLKAVTTGRLEHDEFTVEKLHFQASPGLYVTANLYLPKPAPQRAPTILYVCGHARTVTNGVSCGNKTGYQHHGAWFARNGYVCMLIDTVQLGEIEGHHRGTYGEGQWWWNSRGYTPAGLEAWFGIRSLDYLCSRPEVDPDRIGMTGRSGGGAYSWTIAALDDRIKVAAPVAGITDLQNHVVTGVVDGHCDCMFHLNTYRWDYPQAAALLAPRPLLICNSDKDSIFPLEGVIRTHAHLRRIYGLSGDGAKLGLLITEGPHADTQDLQVPVFRWFNRWLKGEQSVIEQAARKFFAPQDLRVFDNLPAGEINTTIQNTFVKSGASRLDKETLVRELRAKVFRGWPDQDTEPTAELITHAREGGLLFRRFVFDSQPHVELNLVVLQSTRKKRPSRVVLTVLDSDSFANSPAGPRWRNGAVDELPNSLKEELQSGDIALAFFNSRLVDAPAETLKPARLTQIRRRFMLLGQTLDGMRVWDIRCAAAVLHDIAEFRESTITVQASGEMGVNAVYAALFEPSISKLQVHKLPASHMEGPDYLNVLKFTDISQVLEIVADRLVP